MIADLIFMLTAAVFGALAASLAGPSRLSWRGHPLRERVAALAAPSLQRWRRMAGRASLGVIFTSAALTAYAAQPAAPDRLAAEAVGVIGSGDQLRLRLSGRQRIIGLGDEFADGWRLSGLTASEAVLIKEGVTRRIGLNPAGGLSPSMAPDGASPEIVVLASPPPRPPPMRAYTPDEMKAILIARYGPVVGEKVAALDPLTGGSQGELASLRASAEIYELTRPFTERDPTSSALRLANDAESQVRRLQRIAWIEGGRVGAPPATSTPPRAGQ